MNKPEICFIYYIFFVSRITVFKRKKKFSAINSAYMLRPLKEACCIEVVSVEN